MEMNGKNSLLFEVSWEVCNKVGGIYAVVSSKVIEAINNFGDNYYLLGPNLGNNAEFVETDEPCWDILRPLLVAKNLKFRLGRWEIPGRPKVILVNFKERYNQNQLLHELWSRYGVDSLSGGWDYIEPVKFSTACSEVIEAACEAFGKSPNRKIFAHFHEWMCGAGLLNIKKVEPRVATIFTTHATILGRSMAGSGFDIYRQKEQINPLQKAGEYNIVAKYSMEAACAREADCFTTVSRITSTEAGSLLGFPADVVTPNGLDLSVIPDFSINRDVPDANRKRILEATSRLLRRELAPDTRLMLISGRYEFHNKGVNAFMDALHGVNEALRQSKRNVLALCVVMGGHSGVNADAIGGDPNKHPEGMPYWVTSHNVYNPPQDAILRTCQRLGLDNRPDNPVQFIFIPALLDGQDGFLNMPYYDVMSACDLGVFPSWYEPWGYTPEESAALSVPTVTTDLSGYGNWIRDLVGQDSANNGVIIIPRHDTSYEKTVATLQTVLLEYATAPDEIIQARRPAVRALSNACSWQNFYPYYIKAYEHALLKAENRTSVEEKNIEKDAMHLAATNTMSFPTLRSFVATTPIPQEIKRLRELSRNLWWYWNKSSWVLFSELNPEVWESSGKNPVEVIEKAQAERLKRLVEDSVYMKLYEKVMQDFDAYMSKPLQTIVDISPKNPVAYFSMEYGFAESLPIYSGGLGVLSGDHLKSASDLAIPLVGIGLLYKNGYFHQKIDEDGRQVAVYPENDLLGLPISPVTDDLGEPLELVFDLPERLLYANVWQVKVGRITLYLMDTDSPKNTPDDRKITARLYEADRDVRLRQEIVLGIGGIRLLRALGITPAVYHMNEGHSAFLILERLNVYMQEQGLSYDEAAELVRGSNLFTTHTPVDAGNEHFTVDRMERYFIPYVNRMNISWQNFLQLGRSEGSERHLFEMTVLALKFSYKANGVSAMHGTVSRQIWQRLWRGISMQEIPIGHVTNGIHLTSYVGEPVKQLLNNTLGEHWTEESPAVLPMWNKIMDIPDSTLFACKNMQKEALLNAIRDSLPAFFEKFAISVEHQKEMLVNLHPSSLIIGFARRFAPYKRANLLFADPDRLARIIGQEGRPVIFVFAGKSHPADTQGIDILQSVIAYARDPRFIGKVFFLEDYNLAVSRLMVQGCDVWLNNPRRPYEASGTSGQKVPVNVGINLSVSDGWWCEGYNGQNGWVIGPHYDGSFLPVEQSDHDDAESLYRLLEHTVIPLYHNRGATGLPNEWLKVAKHSMRTLIAEYSSHRMVNEYVFSYYLPAAKRMGELMENDKSLVKKLATWKKSMPAQFNTVRILDLIISGIDKKILVGEKSIDIKAIIDCGSMSPKELQVQFVVGLGKDQQFSHKPCEVILEKTTEKGTQVTYNGKFTPDKNGGYVYGVRVIPVIEGLGSVFETQLVLWG